MIDRANVLPLTRQAWLLRLSRSSVYDLPRPVPPARLAIMHRIDALHIEHPFGGSRMLRDLARVRRASWSARLAVATPMRRMGIEALYRLPNTSKPSTWTQDLPASAAQPDGGPAEPSLGHGHHLHFDGARLCLSGGGRGLALETEFCPDAVAEALVRHSKPEIFNTDQGSQFTSVAFTGLLLAQDIAISMDGRGAWRERVFVERLWRSVKYEAVYLPATDSVSDARASLGRYLDFYNGRRPHSSLGARTPEQAYLHHLPQRKAA